MFTQALRQNRQNVQSQVQAQAQAQAQQQTQRQISNSRNAQDVLISTPPKQEQASVGTKRKASTPQSSRVSHNTGDSLEALHNSVYFDENDFDDDDDLDIGTWGTCSATPVPPASTTNTNINNKAQDRKINDKPSSDSKEPTDTHEPIVNLPPPPQPSRPKSPEPPPSIPPLKSNVDLDGTGPRALSGPQIPWSSSPTHQAQAPPPPPQPKKRTLPWAHKLEEAKASEPAVDSNMTKQRQEYPWEPSSSAVKEMQTERRKFQKKGPLTDKDTPTNKSRNAPPKVPSIFLSEEQKRILNIIVEKGKSVFFTGSAGTGKSVLMREVIRQLHVKHKREPDRVAVTASTGLAACNIEGVTLHSFAGVGLGKQDVPTLLGKVKRNVKARTRWMRTKVLVVDEVSMVDGDFFDKLEEIARKIRNNGRPFGGIQLVITGDFFQLPPVPDSNREAKFAFSAATWNTAVEHTILLTQVFRQKDPEFAAMLNEMRLGKLSPETTKAFRSLSRPLPQHDTLEATELFPTRTEVESANSARMGRLSGQIMTFNATDSGSIKDKEHRDRLLANCMAPATIHLKKGAQVMLIKNMDETLVNGSLGRVVAFMDPATFDYYVQNEKEFEDDGASQKDRVAQKLQSMAFDSGSAGSRRKWPLVCFVQPDGTERHLLCQPESWKIELPNGEVEAQRDQVPLILAWALSIHKSQGQTLQRVKVDLGRVFERGQAYVALSRAVAKDGLQVLRFEPRKVMVHPKVVGFYSNLSTAKDIDPEQTTRKPISLMPSANTASNPRSAAPSITSFATSAPRPAAPTLPPRIPLTPASTGSSVPLTAAASSTSHVPPPPPDDEDDEWAELCQQSAL